MFHNCLRIMNKFSKITQMQLTKGKENNIATQVFKKMNEITCVKTIYETCASSNVKEKFNICKNSIHIYMFVY